MTTSPSSFSEAVRSGLQPQKHRDVLRFQQRIFELEWNRFRKQSAKLGRGASCPETRFPSYLARQGWLHRDADSEGQ